MLKITLILILIFVNINAQDNASQELSLFDKEDKQLDLSEYMSQAYGFLPIPIFITEPAVGYGGGLALVYLHDKIGSKKSKSGRAIPPSISAVMFAATQNGTKVAGAAHIGHWLDDTLRTTTYFGSPDVFLDIYREHSAIAMNLQGLFIYQNAEYRIAESNFFIGASYMYFGADATFDFERLETDFGGKSSVAALGVISSYDSRDNILSPNNGIFVNLKALIYDEVLGSDFTLQNYKANGIFYNPLSKKINLDFKAVAQKVVGDKEDVAPYLYPYISMRGLPLMKYQGENVFSLETQLSYQFESRWRALVFMGAGKTFGAQIAQPELSFSDAENIYAGGFGVRYLIAKKFGLRMGVDLAKSKEDEAVYIQFGTAWNGF